MQKIKSPLELRTLELEAFRQKRLEDLKKEIYILNFLKDHHLDPSFIDQYYRIFNEVYVSRKKCENCAGLAHCAQNARGQRLALEYDKIIYDEIEYCPYLNDFKQKEAYLKNYLYSDVPSDLKQLTLSDLVETTSDKNLLYALSMIAEGQSKRGLYIFGDLGVGKTYHCIALLNTLALKGKSVAFVKVNDFINKARKLIINDNEELEDILNDLKNVSYLVLDDLGSESVSSFSRDDLLFDILDYRMEHQKTTLFTSNLDFNSLLEHYAFDKKERKEQLKAKRFVERVEVLAQSYLMKGENKRQK